ncbi:MAG: DinB family protein [Dehalococcoidia bacterium]
MDEQDDSGELPPARDAAEMMRFVRQTRAELEGLVAPLSEAQMAGLKDHAGWSVKDHLAHIVAWEQVLLRGLAGLPEYETFQMTAAELAAHGTTDAVNEILYVRAKDSPLSVVLGDFHRSHEQVTRQLSTMTDADLKAPYALDDPRPKIQKIAGDTYQHYAEHDGWLKTLLEQPSAG